MKKITKVAACVNSDLIATPSTDVAEGTGIASVSESLPKVAILLCTFNGQNYLAEQLDSIESQNYSNWEVHVSDDGSQDGTRAILQSYQKKWGESRLQIHAGPERGFAANFLSLICRSGLDADYCAFSDQDDIWHADKLERAVSMLDLVASDGPGLYCARTCLVDAGNREIGLSPLFSKPPAFANALMQNIGSGNTMVLNRLAWNLLRMAGENARVAAHDWWAYIVVTGCGGKVCYDTLPALRYRQHEGNLIGMNGTWADRFKRIRMLWRGRFRNWNDGHIASLRTLTSNLQPSNLDLLERFALAREMQLLPRLVNFARLGVYRQTVLGNMGLMVAVIFKKL